ncbi:hypothetical protein [Dinoroseobacter sp. S375]|uniref:hypothetical protein n=1 Tax=Dinoroseobacter sp. S375 TaxID=3415136 RepID=UPI003C7E0080
MKEWFEDQVRKVCGALWCHRAGYVGLALAYGAGCAGLLDKEAVSQVVTGLYVALASQRGH